jgi:LEA14-like dessication related protein
MPIACKTPPPSMLPLPEPIAPQVEEAAPPEPEALPILSIIEMKASAIDQHRSSLTITAKIENPRSTEIVLGNPVLELFTSGHSIRTAEAAENLIVAAKTESTFELQLEMDTRRLDKDIPGFSELNTAEVSAKMTATARVPVDAAGQPEDGLFALFAEAAEQVQLIREPDLRILAINLVKHELINVILEVVLEISNPNAFPLEFDQLVYDFFGEGKRWSRGRERKILVIPAKGAASTRIPVMLNFTEMDRRVFDLVEKLQVINYRLGGTATVHTGLNFLPQFSMGFERSGSVKVTRGNSGR